LEQNISVFDFCFLCSDRLIAVVVVVVVVVVVTRSTAPWIRAVFCKEFVENKRRKRANH
jgi:hypothetical protein